MSRKTLVLVLAVLGIALVVWHFLSARISYANFPPPASGPWVAFGDSLTAGYGAEAGHDYPALLGQRLGVEIKNLGVNGHTTADGLNRVEQVTQMNPRVVLLCLGGNDGLQQLPREQMFANLAAIIDRLQGQGAFVVLIGVHSPSLRDANKKFFKKLAGEKRVLYVPDILQNVLGHPQLMSDYLHPNDDGYGVIAGRLEKILRPLLPKLQPAPASAH